MSTVTLYGKADCHLCDGAREALERVRQQVDFELIERDIEADEGLLRSYFERIPVVAVDGQEVFEYFVDEGELLRMLRASRGRGDELESGR